MTLAVALFAGAGLAVWALSADGGSESTPEAAGIPATAAPSAPAPEPTHGTGAEDARGDQDPGRNDRRRGADRGDGRTAGRTQDSAPADREPARSDERQARQAIDDLLGTETAQPNGGGPPKPPRNLAETLLGGAGGEDQGSSKPPRGGLEEILGVDADD